VWDKDMTKEEALHRAIRWESWDCNIDMLSELGDIIFSTVPISLYSALRKVKYWDLQVAADLLSEKYRKMAEV